MHPQCSWRWRELNPRPTLLREGFSGRSPRRPYSASPVMRTCWCDRPSRCLLSLKIPRPDLSVILLTGVRLRGGETPGLTDSLLAQAARAKSARLLAAFIFLQRMVNEIIVAFLGPLHLTRLTLSRPITPGGKNSSSSIPFPRISRFRLASSPGQAPGHRRPAPPSASHPSNWRPRARCRARS